MAFETKGTVKYVLDTKQITGKFSKRSIVVQTDDPKYPQTIEFEATGDKIPLLDSIGEGDMVTIQWDLRGREKRGGDGAFNSLSIWKINVDLKRAKPSAPSGGDRDQIPF